MTDDEHTGLFSMGQVDLDMSEPYNEANLACLPILPTRNLVLFPGVSIPVTLGREYSKRLAKACEDHKMPLGLICQRDPDEEAPRIQDLYAYGVVARVIKVIELPDGDTTALMMGLDKIKVKKPKALADDAALWAEVTVVKDQVPKDIDQEMKVMLDEIRRCSLEVVEKSPEAPDEMADMIKTLTTPEGLVNNVATHMPVEVPVKEEMLSKHRLKDRALMLWGALQSLLERIAITRELVGKAHQSMNEEQRNAFLRTQLDTIHEELYGEEDDSEELAKRAEKARMPKAVKTAFDKELNKLRHLSPQNPDYSVAMNYLDTLLELPWAKKSEVNTDFASAEEALNHNHYGLEKVKDRILEQIAVMMNNPKGRAPILCLVGPPGVGKTSLGQSIGAALGRQYQRVSLGGLHDEAEIRGHRRTYIGAMPGRIIEAMRRAGTVNPVLLLDEVDKVGNDFKGDPSAALLEVLDPEQNCRFHDNFIDVDYDLSNVLFIATANTLSTLSQPLLDRMEIIELSGYLLEEKVEIARLHLLPRLYADLAVTEDELSFEPQALEAIVELYTSESGVRQLEKKLAAVARKVIRKKVGGQPYDPVIRASALQEYLGVAPYVKDRYEGNDFPGVVTGLAWTSVGGEILYIESSLCRGKGEKLNLTGNLGDVMKESAVIALQWVKSHADELGIDQATIDANNLHIHVPEGAIPKDGPSAGITMATSIVSTMTGRKVQPRVAMTGEITLRGKVLPVGGIKEKILAAKRAGIDTIIISRQNQKDVEDIAAKYVQGITFKYVDTVMEVINLALV